MINNKSKLNMYKLSNILFFCMTMLLAVRYIYIVKNPVIVDGIETFPYKTRTGVYLFVLVVIDMVYVISNLLTKSRLDIETKTHEKVNSTIDYLYQKLKKIVLNDWFKVIITMLIFITMSISIYNKSVINYNYTEYREKTIPYISVCELTDEITDGNVLEQSFKTQLDEIKGVYLRTATYMRENSSHLDITILTMDDTVLASESFLVTNASDNDFTYFSFQSPVNLQGIKELRCRITSKDNYGGNGITIYRSAVDKYQDGNLTINGSDSGFDCFLELAGKQYDDQLISAIYIILCTCISIFMLVIGFLLFNKKKSISPEKLFLVIAVAIGLQFIFIIPPYAEHDGEAHFNTIYKYSNIVLGHEVSSERQSIDKELKDIFGQQFSYPTNKGDYYAIQRIVSEKDNRKEMYGVQEIATWLVDFPVVYVFSILGVVIGRLLGLNIIYIYLLARCFNFCGYILLTFCAIRMIPICKKSLLMIAIFPMTLLQAASVSYDAIIIGTALLFISLCIYLVKNKVRIRYLALLILLSFCILCFKQGVYFPLLGIILLVPLNKQLSMKQRIMFWSAWIACVSIAAIALYVDAGKTVQETSQVVTQVGETYPLTYSLKHPVGFIKMLCTTLYGSFEYYFKDLFGIKIFGFWEYNTPLILCIPPAVFLYLINRYEKNDIIEYIGDKKRVWIFICGIFSFLMIFLGAMSWTTRGDSFIHGIQGRYFIPILPLFLFFGNRTEYTTKEQSKNILYYMYSLDGCYVLYVFLRIISNTSY